MNELSLLERLNEAVDEIAERVVGKQKAMQKMVEAGLTTAGVSSQIDGLLDAYNLLITHIPELEESK